MQPHQQTDEKQSQQEAKQNDVKEEKKDGEKDKKKDKKEDQDEMSEEDQKLQSALDLLVTVLLEQDASKSASDLLQLQTSAAHQLQVHIKSATSSMTSVPKPLKFLRTHVPKLTLHYDTLPTSSSLKYEVASILAILSMTQENKGHPALRYKLLIRSALQGEQGNIAFTNEQRKDLADIGYWGHEFVRHLAGEIGKEYTERSEKNQSTDELDPLISEILPFFMAHNADFDAVDLLIECSALDKLPPFVNKDNVERVASYITKCSDYVSDIDELRTMLGIVFTAYLSTDRLTDALRVAVRLGDMERIEQVFNSTHDALLRKQLALMLGSFKIVPPFLREDEELLPYAGNVNLHAWFQQLASDLDVKEAKTPEDIYKSHLEEGGARRNLLRGAPTGQTGVDSAKQNLASTFVNAFVNAAFGKDNLITPEGSDWLYKNKSHGMLSATASLGLLLLWDVESGFSSVDRYSFSTQSFIKAGAAMAHGMLSSGITSEMDAAQALLSEHLESKDVDMRLSAIFGLGLAYVGTCRDDVLEMLTPILVDGANSIEIVAHTALALGMVFAGSANDIISSSIVEELMSRASDSPAQLNDPVARLMVLGVALLYLGQQEACEGINMAIAAVEHPIKQYLLLSVETAAYAGSNSVLTIQKLLKNLTEHISSEEDEKDPFKGLYQEISVLGIALVSTEDIAAEMALRSLDHILQYGETNVRRVIPLAYGLLSISNPRLTVMDTLSKLSHDQDERVSQNAVFAMGLIGAGTNNSRLATALRQLATYYAKEPNHLFLVRIAQGLLHMGKGLMTISPMQSDGMVMNKVAMAGVLTLMHSTLDMKNTLLSKRHYLLFSLVTAIRPRMLMTLDGDSSDLNPIAVQVRVGQKVDTVGQAGKPKKITGFQSHTTPVLLAAGERAELSSDEYLALSTVLEGVVIVKKNPNYKPPQ